MENGTAGGKDLPVPHAAVFRVPDCGIRNKMDWLHYIDNEVPTFGEWDAVIGQMSRTAEAAWPERGSYGLRSTVSGGNVAYARKDFASAVSSMALGFWFKFPSEPTWEDGQYFFVARARNASRLGWYVALLSDQGNVCLRLVVYAGTGGALYDDTYHLKPGRWYYVAIIAAWNGSAGTADLYIDGVHRGQALRAVDATSNYPDQIRMGNPVNCTGQAVTLDFDEIKVRDDTTYPEPYVPTPANEYPSAERTVVLWRGASDDSRQFGDYCVAALGIPRANLIRLDNASADEVLADYATFQAEVEDDIATYLGLHPTVAANCSCFLIGYGVPGCFTEAALVHSAASRLMNYGTAFSSGTANPLYNPSTVARLTKTALGGKYLCTRIDTATLAHAKDMIDRAAIVSALAALADGDKLYSDELAYRASLPCQRLRCLTAALGTYSDDAFVWGDTGAPAFDGAGSRACFVDDSDQSALLLRSGSAACREALYAAVYAAALGSSHTADTFDAGSFFEMLRIGGTLAEAFIVAISKLDYTPVPVGSPLMTVAFQVSGYNVYRGIGGPEQIDWNNPVAYLRPSEEAISFAQTLLPAQRYIYGVRTVSGGGLEERNTHVVTYVEIDGNGNLLPPPLARPEEVTATVQTDGNILMGFSYRAPLGYTSADGFDILSDHGTGRLDLENPVATIDEVDDAQCDFEISIEGPQTPLLLAVRPRYEDRTGPLSRTVFVSSSSPPGEAKVL